MTQTRLQLAQASYSKTSHQQQPAEPSRSLQECGETCTRERGKSLPECINLSITRSLPHLKILQCEITTLVQVCVPSGQSLQRTHHSLQLCLCLHLLGFSLCLGIRLVHNFLVLGVNRGVSLFHKLLVFLLGIFFCADSFCLQCLC